MCEIINIKQKLLPLLYMGGAIIIALKIFGIFIFIFTKNIN